MTENKTIKNNYYEIYIPDSLIDYGYEVFEYSTNKIIKKSLNGDDIK